MTLLLWLNFHLNLFLFVLFFLFLAVVLINGRRYNDTAVILEWTPSPGTTRYDLSVGFPNGTFVTTYLFPLTSSFVVPDLAYNVTYRFTLYSGNADGVDTTEGPYIDASSLSTQFFFFQKQHFFCETLSFSPVLFAGTRGKFVLACHPSWPDYLYGTSFFFFLCPPPLNMTAFCVL